MMRCATNNTCVCGLLALEISDYADYIPMRLVILVCLGILIRSTIDWLTPQAYFS